MYIYVYVVYLCVYLIPIGLNKSSWLVWLDFDNIRKSSKIFDRTTPLCVYIYIYIYTYVRTIYKYARMYIYMYIVYVCIYIYIYIYI